MNEHPIQQPIFEIAIDTIPDVQNGYQVGRNGVTRIEACEKCGPYSMIPYVRVWAGDTCRAEFCQHNIVGIYFAVAPEFDEVPPVGGWPADHTGLPGCLCTECFPF